MTQSATAVTTTGPTVGPAIGVGLIHSMLWSPGLRAIPGAGNAWPVALRRMQRP
jgi:hypothetical protein